MSWKLRKPNVSLGVTRFSPAKPIAGLPPQVREELRAKRTVETRKIEPATEWVETRLFSGRFVEVQAVEPCPDDCRCDLCARIAERLARKYEPYDELYIKKRRQSDGI